MLRKVPTYVYMSSIEGLLPINTNVEQARVEALFIKSKLLADGDKCIEFRDVDGNVSKVDPNSGLGIFVFSSRVTGKAHKFEACDWKSAEIELSKVEEAYEGELEENSVDADVDDAKPKASMLHRSFVAMSRRRRRRKNAIGRLHVHTSRL